MRSKLLGFAIIAAMSLTACNNGSAATTTDGTSAAACARVATITTQLADMREQMRLDSIKDGIGSAQERQDLERQMEPLRVELVVQNKVCKG